LPWLCLSLCEWGYKAVVVVARLDRLFRSVADAALTIADFDRRGVES
jgi:DNA invertase Pin-like site-specific DNA recombinase